jgi:hypothetical protein
MSLAILLIVIIISALIIKIGALSLRMTGIDRETAAFQALSAFSGTGFTTWEAEQVVNHPQRRRIVKALMILGNAGIVTALAMLFLSLQGATFSNALAKFGVIGLVALLVLAFPLSRGLDSLLENFIMKRLSRSTHFSMGAFSQIMKFARGYGIAEILVDESDRICGKELAQSGLTSSDILVLAIRRKNRMTPAPKSWEKIEPGDRLVCFGPLENIASAVGDGSKGEAGE